MTETRSDIIIVGAGFAGVGLGIRLKERGIDDFIIIERAQDVGGAWRDNVYPGVACDVPSLLYSYSFRATGDWSRVYAPGREIWDYIRTCAIEDGVMDHIAFGVDLERAEWDPAAGEWVARTSVGVYRTRMLIGAMGHLADPKIIDVPGRESFAGSVFHSAQWDPAADLAGKRVGVVGTGASALQIIPRMAEIASEVVVFQRSACYVVPRADRPYTAAERRRFARDPEAITEARETMFWEMEANFAQRRMVPEKLEEGKAMALGHLAGQIADVELRAKLTPDYEIGCKRVLISNEYFPTFEQPHVTLETSGFTGFVDGKAVAASGNEYELDALVLATGFEAAKPIYAPHFVNGEGRSLEDEWRDGMHAYGSITVNGFPNLFLINGPNTGLGHNSVLFVIESQIEFLLGMLDDFSARGLREIEVTPAAEQFYEDEVTKLSAGTVWIEGGCKNWYVDPNTGKLTVTWPDFAYAFRDYNGTYRPADFAGVPA